MAIAGPMLQLARNQMMQNAGKIKQTMQMIQTASNPQAAMNMIIMNNPNMKQVMEIVNKYGGDSMKALEATAGQFGMTANEVLCLLR